MLEGCTKRKGLPAPFKYPTVIGVQSIIGGRVKGILALSEINHIKKLRRVKNHYRSIKFQKESVFAGLL